MDTVSAPSWNTGSPRSRRGQWMVPKLLLALALPSAGAGALLLQVAGVAQAAASPLGFGVGVTWLLALALSAVLLNLLVVKPLRERLEATAPRGGVPAATRAASPDPSSRIVKSLTAQLDVLQKEKQALSGQLERLATEQNTASAALSAAVTLTHDRLLLTDAEGRIRDISPTALELLDLPRAGVLGRCFHEAVKLYDGDMPRPTEYPLDSFLTRVIENRSTLPRLAEALLINRVGKRQPVLVSAAAILEPGGRLIGSLARLETYGGAAAGAAPAAGMPAASDPATGLGDVRAFERRLDELLKIARTQNASHALLFLSPDNFDAVNDEHGHWAGEELLWKIGQMLRTEAPEGGDAFRVGGQHLALLLPFTAQAEAMRLAERVRLAVDGSEFKWQELCFEAAVSIAVVPLPPDAEGYKVLLGLANKALAAAKAGGGNRVSVAASEASLTQRRRQDREWVGWVSRRINEGHAQIASQAIQPLRAGTRLKPLLELQLRIADEKGVRVPSSAFLPSVVRHNLTARFDLWLLRRAIRMLGEQPALLKQFHAASIDVARSSLTEPDFAERVAEVLAESPVPSPHLCFAIDARSAINHPSDVHRFVNTLKSTGAQFALVRCKAALGLTALSTLPIHYVKIHESLIRKALENPLDHGYVRWINQVTHDLGRLTIAAGVDSAAIQDAMREIGIDYRQGAELAVASGAPHAALAAA